MPIKPFFDRAMSIDKRDIDRDWEKLVHNFHVANMGCRIIDSEIVTQFLDNVLCVAGGFCLDTHPKVLAGPDVRDLRIASFEHQVMVNSLPFRIASKRLVLYNHFNSEIWHCHCVQVQCRVCIKLSFHEVYNPRKELTF